MEWQKYKKFLPSKKFVKIVSICGGSILLVFIVTSFFGSHNIFTRNTQPKVTVDPNGTVGDLMTQDSNNNGIPDWEESLWGLDPKADGATNKQIIDEKKAASNITPVSNDTNPNDKFSQDLLSTILALNQSGSLTPEAISQIAQSISSTVDSKHVVVPTYNTGDINIVPANVHSIATYKTALKKILSKYSNLDLGSELKIIAYGLGDGGPISLQDLDPYAKAYTDIGKKIIALPTPINGAANSLELANTSIEMGADLVQVENIYTDVLTGMVGLDDYTKASDVSDNATQKMKAYLSL